METPAADELRRLLRNGEGLPDSVRGNPAAIAYSALQSIRDSGDPTFLFARTALELSASLSSGGASGIAAAEGEEILFHCATGWRRVLLRGWESEYRPEFRTCVRDWALSVGLGLTKGGSVPLPKTASKAFLGLAAGAWKRGWNDPPDGGKPASDSKGNTEAQNHLVNLMMNGPIHSVHRPVDSSQLFQMLEALLTKGLGGQSCEQADMRASVASADFLSILLGEFSGTGQGGFGGYRQPLSFHTQVLSAFEGGALDEVLRIGMAALGAAVQIFQGGVSQDAGLVQLTSSVIELTCDTVGWEFSSGRNSWELTSARLASTSGSLIRPPERWRQALIRPDFLGAVFAVYDVVRGQPKTQDLAHGVRQLLLLLSSVTGTVFENEEQRLAYASFLVDGCLAALRKLHEYNQRRAQTNPNEEDEATIAETVDLCSMICRLVANFRLQRLSKLPSFPTLLDAVASLGNDLLHQNLAACQQVDGNLEDYADSNEGRDEALGQLLEGTVLMAEDPWLLGGAPGEEETVRMVTAILAKSLAPLYQSYISTRIGMARLEETFFFSRDLDEVREEISSAAADEEMTSAASLGRMDVSASVACLSFFLNQSLPRLQAMWEIPGGVMLPETAALLEEVRLLIVCVAHILTDECDGETPSVPDAVARACSLSCSGDAANATTASVSGLVQSLISLAELQASRVAADPSDVRLSPLLAKTLLWFFKRWAPSYVLTRSNEYSKGRDMLTLWSSGEAALQAVSFCCALCIHYNCQWPHEGQVQEEATALLLALARRGKDIRGLLVLSQPFEQIATLHSITAGLRHSASDEEIGSAVSSAGNENLPLEMVRGYQRLPYEQRSKVLTALLVGSSEPHDARAVAISQLCLRAVHGPFASLVQALM